MNTSKTVENKLDKDGRLKRMEIMLQVMCKRQLPVLALQ
jgi:hypothetical protein